MKRIIKRFRIDNQVRVGYGTAFFLLMISYLITMYVNRQLVSQTYSVDHSNRIIYYIETIISNLKDGETGVRGYMIMKDQKFLGPYYTSRQSVDSVKNILEGEVAKNPLQKARLDSLMEMIYMRYDNLHFSIRHMAINGFNVDDTLHHIGIKDRLLMDDIRSIAMRMQLHEEHLLVTNSKELAERFTALNTIIIASLCLALLVVILAFLTYIRENRARRKADEQIGDYQQELQRRIEELDGANKELIQMRSIEKFAATGRIARTIAHEVRNPLTNINLAIEQIKSEMDIEAEDASQTILFDMVTRNSNRINQLITDLLNSTKFSELNYETVHIGEILDDSLELAKDRLALNNIQVERKYHSNCTVMADVDKIKIAFLNIIVNAIEAMVPGKGVLKLIVVYKKGRCIITIIDNGGGMDQEALTKLFEPYFTSKSTGNGLGLTNTQNIILNHKGSITVDSTPGVGTTFVITLNAVK